MADDAAGAAGLVTARRLVTEPPADAPGIRAAVDRLPDAAFTGALPPA